MLKTLDIISKLGLAMKSWSHDRRESCKCHLLLSGIVNFGALCHDTSALLWNPLYLQQIISCNLRLTLCSMTPWPRRRHCCWRRTGSVGTSRFLLPGCHRLSLPAATAGSPLPAPPGAPGELTKHALCARDGHTRGHRGHASRAHARACAYGLVLLDRVSVTQGSNPGLPHCGWILYQLSHKGSPRILEWIACPFSNGSS